MFKLKVDLLISIVFILVSCDVHTVDNIYIINNKSNDTITVYSRASGKSYSKLLENIDSFQIAPCTEKVFYVGRTNTLNSINKKDDYLLSFDTIQIKPKNGQLRLDIHNMKNWNYRNAWGIFGVYKTFLKFQIENKDIVK